MTTITKPKRLQKAEVYPSRLQFCRNYLNIFNFLHHPYLCLCLCVDIYIIIRENIYMYTLKIYEQTTVIAHWYTFHPLKQYLVSSCGSFSCLTLAKTHQEFFA